MASQPQSWKECRPANNLPFDDDLDAVAGHQTAERRPKMDAYCRYLVPEPEKSLEDIRSKGEEVGFQRFFNQGHKEVIHERVEFLVDKYVWLVFLKQLAEDKRPAFPWAKIQLGDIPDTGLSVKYEQRLAARSSNPPPTAEGPAAETPAPSEAAKKEVTAILGQNATVQATKTALSNWVMVSNSKLTLADRINLAATVWRAAAKNLQEDAITFWIVEVRALLQNLARQM
ncbi:hypothetical protein MAC_02008 [Metarhizium acridum CQMa 102]|uniref:Uncharacterized protein n=1 Tax=Metarhizium acridum (strain CQMa 102) TaxID=655827 RepID=E9DWL0_METAQ|nr:uncharacterized protein MAC_02008 [Metarhizium acridum CQMa 102]EFY92060.1 hypothetical protein MAC_02008 [Metarhizium acridum CQMa 102]